MDFRRLTRQFIQNEGKGPSVSSYLQSISEVLQNISPRSRTDERRIEMARQSLDRLMDQPPRPPPLTRQRATIGRTHAIVDPRTAEVGTSIPATSHSAPPHRSAVSRRLFYNMDVPPQPVLRRQIGYSPAVYQLHEGNDERQQIRSILNQGEIGDIVRYVPNNPEGFREFRIVFSENPGAPPNTKILQEID